MNDLISEILYAVLIVIVIVVIAALGVVVINAMGNSQSPQITSTRLTESESMGLGRQLVFPEGWTPVLFSATSFDKGGFVFICEREHVYRYCTPVVIEAGND